MMKIALCMLLLVAAEVSESRRVTEKGLLQLPLIPKASILERRRRQLLSQEDAIQLDALYQGYGEHYVDLWVGTPPQRQTLIVSTDSHVAGFPCSACQNCGTGAHTDWSFDERLSTSFATVPCNACETGTSCLLDYCDMHVSYAEGSSWHAYEAKDIVYAGGPHDKPLLEDDSGDSDLDPEHAVAFKFRFLFGCQTEITGLFKTQLADGVMGMNKHVASMWSQMFKEGIISSKSFSLCYVRQPRADRRGTEAGAMTLGGYDARLHQTTMRYSVATVDDQTTTTGIFHAVPDMNFHAYIRKIHLRHGDGGQSAVTKNEDAYTITLNITSDRLNSPRMIVASGTTDTYLPGSVEALFKNAYYLITGSHYENNSVMLTATQLKALPTILLQLAGDEEKNKALLKGTIDSDHPHDVILSIPPSHYMEYSEGSMVYTPRIYFDSQNPSLGANAMMGHDTFFNVAENVIGWAESDCDYHSLLEESGFQDDMGDDGSDYLVFGNNDLFLDDIFSDDVYDATDDFINETGFGLETPTMYFDKEGTLQNNKPAILPAANCSSWFECNQAASGAILVASCVTMLLGLLLVLRRKRTYSAILGQELEMNDMSSEEHIPSHYEIAPEGNDVERELPSVT